MTVYALFQIMLREFSHLKREQNFWIFKKGYRLLWIYFFTGDTLHHNDEKNGMTSLRENSFSHMAKVILAGSLLVSWVILVLKSQIKKQDDSGRILILDVKVGDNDFLLINLYNANNASEQLNTQLFIIFWAILQTCIVRT